MRKPKRKKPTQFQEREGAPTVPSGTVRPEIVKLIEESIEQNKELLKRLANIDK